MNAGKMENMKDRRDDGWKGSEAEREEGMEVG